MTIIEQQHHEAMMEMRTVLSTGDPGLDALFFFLSAFICIVLFAVAIDRIL